jgi:nucleotide-binding universal stress UspA family protein
MNRVNPVSVVLGTDFSDCSRRAEALAVEQARLLGARLHIVHVSSWLHGENEEALLRNVAARASGLETVTFLTFGGAAGELARYAHDCRAAYIVVGTHGRRGVSHFLLGSTAERLLRLAHCPVLVVPPLDPAEATLGHEAEDSILCLVCRKAAGEDRICDSCRAQIRGEAIMHQQDEARKAHASPIRR